MELEGYAKYLETDYLNAKYYPMATLYYHASFVDKIVHGIVSLSTPGGGDEATKTRSSQYTDGLALYRERDRVPGIPVKFQLDLTRYPGGERFV